MAAAEKASFGPSKPGWPEYRLASAALKHADALRLSGPAENPCSLLYRDAVLLLGRARAAYGDAGSDQVVARGLEPDGPLARFLGEHGAAALAGLTPADARLTSLALRRAALELLAPLTRAAAARRRVRLARAVRIGVLLSLFLGCAIVALHHRNLALGRPVSVSPADTGSPDPSQLVDGKTRNLGFQSSGAPPHRVTIDLGAQRLVSRVVVYNREDCCQERAVPLRIELGDGQHFVEVAARDRMFNVWRAGFPARQGRFVRLSSVNPAPFHLAEVEVY